MHLEIILPRTNILIDRFLVHVSVRTDVVIDQVVVLYVIFFFQVLRFSCKYVVYIFDGSINFPAVPNLSTLCLGIGTYNLIHGNTAEGFRSINCT